MELVKEKKKDRWVRNICACLDMPDAGNFCQGFICILVIPNRGLFSEKRLHFRYLLLESGTLIPYLFALPQNSDGIILDLMGDERMVAYR